MTRKTVSFCFDDGFLSSTDKTVRVFEDRGLRTSFCIMAAPTESVDIAHQGVEFADWDLWRALRNSGHDIAPHGWAHERLEAMEPDAARQSINRMFEMFEIELPGFHADETIFHTPYLSLPSGTLDWLCHRTAAVRVATGGGGISSSRAVHMSRIIDCITFGPDNVAQSLARHIDNFGQSGGDWLTLVLHGLDGEGWGSLRLAELEHLVDNCLERGYEIRPLADIL